MPSSSVLVLFNVLSGAVALLISYYAYRNNKLVGSTLLRYISIGFLLLGIGIVLEAGTQAVVGITLVDAVHIRGIGLVDFLISTGLQLVAYAVFAWGYGLSALRKGEGYPVLPAPAVLATLSSSTRKLVDYVFIVTVFLASQFGIIVLLLFIVYQGTRIFSRTRNSLSLMVLFGFSLIFAAHLLLFASAIYLSSTLLLIGDTIQLCGFLSLLFFLFWSARVGK